MKLRLALLPLIVLAGFLYTASVLDRSTEHGTKKVTLQDIKAEAKKDLAKFTPSTVLVINE